MKYGELETAIVKAENMRNKNMNGVATMDMNNVNTG